MLSVCYVVAQAENVGARCTNEARELHCGESEGTRHRRPGLAEQTRELLEEGIAVMPLPLPEGLRGR